MIEALNILDEKGIAFRAGIVGAPGERDKNYYELIRKEARALEEKGKIEFLGKVPNHKLPEIYNRYFVFVNLSPAGLFDKAVLEAMACGCLVLASSHAFEEILPERFLFEEGSGRDLADKLEAALNLSESEAKELSSKFRDYVAENHSLSELARKVSLALSGSKE